MKRKLLNELRHREARRKAGLPGCADCRDTRQVIQTHSGRPGHYGFSMDNVPCYACLGDWEDEKGSGAGLRGIVGLQGLAEGDA